MGIAPRCRNLASRRMRPLLSTWGSNTSASQRRKHPVQLVPRQRPSNEPAPEARNRRHGPRRRLGVPRRSHSISWPAIVRILAATRVMTCCARRSPSCTAVAFAAPCWTAASATICDTNRSRARPVRGVKMTVRDDVTVDRSIRTSCACRRCSSFDKMVLEKTRTARSDLAQTTAGPLASARLSCESPERASSGDMSRLSELIRSRVALSCLAAAVNCNSICKMAFQSASIRENTAAWVPAAMTPAQRQAAPAPPATGVR